MILLLFLILLFTCNWVFSEILVYIPLSFWDFLDSLIPLSGLVILIGFLAWCFGE